MNDSIMEFLNVRSSRRNLGELYGKTLVCRIMEFFLIRLTPPIHILSVSFSVAKFLWKLFVGQLGAAVLSLSIS